VMAGSHRLKEAFTMDALSMGGSEHRGEPPVGGAGRGSGGYRGFNEAGLPVIPDMPY
jgi:hypothetical protein